MGDGLHRRVGDSQRSHEVFQKMYVPFVLVYLELLFPQFALHVGQLLLLGVYDVSELPHAVVILQLVLGDDEATALLAEHRPLGIVLALFQMRHQTVKLDHHLTSVHDIVAADAEAGQQVSKDPWNRPELSGGDQRTVQGARGLSVYPFVNACTTESVLAYRRLDWVLQDSGAYRANKFLVDFALKSGHVEPHNACL